MTPLMIRRAPLLLLALGLTACDDDRQCGPYDPTVEGYEMMAPTKADLIRLRAQTPTKPQPKASPASPAPEEADPEETANKGRPGTGVTMFPADYVFPKEEIFPVTEKIHKLISQKDSPSKAEEMKSYELKIAPVPDYGINMIPLPGGEVTLGSPEGEEDREDDEEQRTVKIEPFWIASTETTWALYIEFMDNGKPRNKGGTLDLDTDRNTQEAPDVDGDAPLVDVVSQPTPPYTGMHFNMGEGGYDNAYPAISMTHHAASKFCEWLSAHTGEFYRLPTEAEWEYAARAGTKEAYSFGNDADSIDDYAWHEGNSDDSYQPVGKKKANPWGLFDMHGNAAEWVLDAGDDEFRTSLPNGILNPWRIPIDRYPRLTKGGSWRESPDRLRSGARTQSSKTWKIIDPQVPKSVWYHTNTDEVMPMGHAVGFRIVRPLAVPPAKEMHLYWNTDWWDPARNAQDL